MNLYRDEPAVKSPRPGSAAGREGPKDKLDHLIESIPHLPPSPALVGKLLAIFKQPDRDVDNVVELIRNDPPLTAEILRRCNSAFYGGENPVRDIFEAVSRVGFYEVYRSVTVVAGSRTMRIAIEGAGLNVDLLWEHSLAAAVSAGVIARHVDAPEAPAFTAGLLHDVGKILLALAGGTRYARLAAVSNVPGVSLIEAEREVFGFDHGQVGGRLLERWQLSNEVATAVHYHHYLAGAGESRQLAAVVAFADVMGHQLRSGMASDALGLAIGGEAMAVLNLEPDTAARMLEQARQDLELESRMAECA